MLKYKQNLEMHFTIPGLSFMEVFVYKTSLKALLRGCNDFSYALIETV